MMMELDKISTLVISGLALAGLWVIYFWFYWDYRVDKSRQEFFKIRDELFDFAASGQIAFNHPAYVLLRRTMNGMVRFTHKVDFNLVLAFSISSQKPAADDFRNSLDEAMATIESEKVKKKLEEFFFRMNIALAKHIVFGSISLMFAMGILLLCALGWASVVRIFQKPINQIDTTAAALGSA